MAQAEQIRDEGARYNLGNMRSTIGNPVMALGVLQKLSAALPLFAREGRPECGPDVWIVDYKEETAPAMIRGEPARSVAHGRLWIDAMTRPRRQDRAAGRTASIRAVVTTTFRPDERFDIARAARDARALHVGQRQRINTVATYGRFRRFDVSADEDIHSPRPTLVDPWTGMTFVELTPGRFTMGSASAEVGRNDDETLHDVEITRPFLLGQFEVTQQEWRTVMGTSPSHFAGADRGVRSRTSRSTRCSSSWRS